MISFIFQQFSLWSFWLLLIYSPTLSIAAPKTLASAIPFSTTKDLDVKSKSKDPFEAVQTLTLDMLDACLRPALEEQLSEKFVYELARHPFPLEVLADQPVQLDIQDLKINDKKTRFTVKVLFRGFDSTPFMLTGTLSVLVSVPTLNRPVNPQESIQEMDIHWIEVPGRQVNRSTITTAEQLIGAEPRQGVLHPDIVLRLNDVKRAKAVKRNSLVMIKIETSGLHMDMQAKALEDGDVGQMIKLQNSQSMKTIQGKVVGPQEVDISPPAFFSISETHP